ncbi:GFA family protein [Chthonobacter rhizosphaerae]|uniref:GFA family protein n=1 Tax=Chthonobacter rhizosphaerae TaxID=2735553 RepID=UPI0015EF3B87|nr:GFA family protein [Chthonobacter rhizosphaerae]
MAKPALTGGCLCGRIRYRAASWTHAVHCHCGMCRRVSGALFLTWVCLRTEDLAFTAEPAVHRSSETVTRAFCPACGSTLAMTYEDAGESAVSLGTLDDPDAVDAARNIFTDDRLRAARGFDATLPDVAGMEDPGAQS